MVRTSHELREDSNVIGSLSLPSRQQGGPHLSSTAACMPCSCLPIVRARCQPAAIFIPCQPVHTALVPLEDVFYGKPFCERCWKVSGVKESLAGRDT